MVKSTGSWYTVKNEDGDVLDCKIKGYFRMQGIRSTNPVAVGDWVKYSQEAGSEIGVITEIFERKNYIIRKSSNLSKQSNIMAANVDQALLVVTLICPETNLEFIDRFLVSAEAYRVPSKIIFNKVDIYTDALKEYMRELEDVYQKIGYECIETSATLKLNMDVLRTLLKDKITVFSGNSGVGKSSLINALDEKLDLKTAGISTYHLTGKHTTTFSQLFDLSSGGYIIDTPGIKGFGLIEMEKAELSHFFPEIFKASQDCQFYNCTHTHEPNCIVRKLVEDGTIADFRYNNYLSLFHGDENKYRL